VFLSGKVTYSKNFNVCTFYVNLELQKLFFSWIKEMRYHVRRATEKMGYS
jgi:hypothetical protein